MRTKFSIGRGANPARRVIGAESYGATKVRGHTEFPLLCMDGNTNRLASLCAGHEFSNLAVLFPANADPGLARLIFDQTVNRSVAELLQVESLKGY